jgi:hypothetical protein
MLLIAFLAIFVYALIASRSRIRTAGYTLGSMAAAIAAAWVISLWHLPVSRESIGSASVYLAELIGSAVAVFHARQTAR